MIQEETELKTKKIFNVVTSRFMTVFEVDKDNIYRPRERFNELMSSNSFSFYKELNINIFYNSVFHESLKLNDDLYYYPCLASSKLKKLKYPVSDNSIILKVSESLLTTLFNNACQDKKGTVQDLREELENKGYKMSVTSVYKLLKYHGYSFKTKSKYVGMSKMHIDQMKFLFLHNLIDNVSSYNLAFADTSTFKVYDNSIYMWCNKWKELVGSYLPATSVHLRLFMTWFWSGEVLFQFNSTLKEDDANIKSYLIMIAEAINNSNKPTLLILDNQTEQHCEEVTSAFLKYSSKLKVLYIPPGESNLNAVEYLFCVMKQKLRKKRLRRLKEIREEIKLMLKPEMLANISSIIRKRYIKYVISTSISLNLNNNLKTDN